MLIKKSGYYKTSSGKYVFIHYHDDRTELLGIVDGSGSVGPKDYWCKYTGVHFGKKGDERSQNPSLNLMKEVSFNEYSFQNREIKNIDTFRLNNGKHAIVNYVRMNEVKQILKGWVEEDNIYVKWDGLTGEIIGMEDPGYNLRQKLTLEEYRNRHKPCNLSITDIDMSDIPL